MKFPEIDLATIPGLESATGIYGSVASSAVNYEDSVVAIMVIVYEAAVPAAMGIA